MPSDGFEIPVCALKLFFSLSLSFSFLDVVDVGYLGASLCQLHDVKEQGCLNLADRALQISVQISFQCFFFSLRDKICSFPNQELQLRGSDRETPDRGNEM